MKTFQSVSHLIGKIKCEGTKIILSDKKILIDDEVYIQELVTNGNIVYRNESKLMAITIVMETQEVVSFQL